MNPEKYIQDDHEEALEINEKVDAFYEEHPRSRRSADDVAAEIIKEEDARPLRMDRVPDDLRPWYGNLREAGVKILDDHFLEITRWDKRSGADDKKPLRQKVDGINSALRMQDYILTGYRNEAEPSSDEYSKLESIQEVIEYANELLNDWGSADANERKHLQQQLADVVLQLERCTNEFKVETKEQAEAVMKLKDSRGRENPGALAARTVAALNNLTKRMEEMQIISPLIAMRKETLAFEKRRMEGVMRKADALLAGVSNHAVFHAGPPSEAGKRIRSDEVETLNRKIGQVLYLLGTVHIAPYSQQGEQAAFFVLKDLKPNFRSKARLIENLDAVRAAIADIRAILQSDVSDLG